MLNIRIGISKETVKALEATLRQAYRAGDVGNVKRVTALVRLSRKECAVAIAPDLGCWLSSIYEWLKKLVYDGVNGLKVTWPGGRHSPLSKRQKARWGEVIKAGS